MAYFWIMFSQNCLCLSLHMLGGRVFWGEIHLRKYGMPAFLPQGLKIPGSGPSFLIWKMRGCLGELCGSAPGRLCAAYQGGGVESHVGDQSRRAPAWRRDIRIGKSFRGLREERPSDTTHSAGDEGGEGAILEFNEIKINSHQSPFPTCFPPLGNFICIFMVVVCWSPVWSKFDKNKRAFSQKEKSLD